MEYKFLSSYKWTGCDYDGSPIHHNDTLVWLYDTVTECVVQTELGWKERKRGSVPDHVQKAMNVYMKESSKYRVLHDQAEKANLAKWHGTPGGIIQVNTATLTSPQGRNTGRCATRASANGG